MTEENNSETVKEQEPFDIQDPSDRDREVVRAALDPDPEENDGGDPGDEHSDPVVPSSVPEPEPFKVSLGKIEDYLDADLAKTVSGVFEQMSQKISDLETKLNERPAEVPKEDSGMFVAHSELFGTDDPSPEEEQNRGRIREQIGILKAGYKSAGKKSPSAQVLFEKALRSEFPDAAIDKDRKQFTTKVKNRERQIMARPSSRAGESVSARDRAAQAVAQRMRDLGINQ